MKRSIIWTTAGIAAIGFGVPAFAAANGSTNQPTTPASVNVTMATTATPNTVKSSGADSARDIAEAAAVTTASVTPASVTPASVTPTSVDDATDNSVDDDATTNSVEDATDNSVDNEADDDDATEDVSGNCDEAEHANDPACTGTAATSNTVDDNSGHGSDDSGHGGNDG